MFLQCHLLPCFLIIVLERWLFMVWWYMEHDDTRYFYPSGNGRRWGSRKRCRGCRVPPRAHRISIWKDTDLFRPVRSTLKRSWRCCHRGICYRWFGSTRENQSLGFRKSQALLSLQRQYLCFLLVHIAYSHWQNGSPLNLHIWQVEGRVGYVFPLLQFRVT